MPSAAYGTITASDDEDAMDAVGQHRRTGKLVLSCGEIVPRVLVIDAGVLRRRYEKRAQVRAQREQRRARLVDEITWSVNRFAKRLHARIGLLRVRRLRLPGSRPRSRRPRGVRRARSPGRSDDDREPEPGLVVIPPAVFWRDVAAWKAGR